MELMDTSLDKFYRKVLEKNMTIPEDILGEIAVSVSGLHGVGSSRYIASGLSRHHAQSDGSILGRTGPQHGSSCPLPGLNLFTLYQSLLAEETSESGAPGTTQIWQLVCLGFCVQHLRFLDHF